MAKSHTASPSPVRTPLALTPGVTNYSTKLWDERPTFIKQNVVRNVCLLLFVATALEETASFSMSQSLKNFFQKLGWSNKGSNAMRLTYDSVAQFACILAGYVADERIGKFNTLFRGASLDTIGFSLLVIASLPAVLASKTVAKVLFSAGLYLGVALTQVTLRSMMLSFGGDQFSPDLPPDKKGFFFSFHYAVANIGATLGYAVFPSICLHGIGSIPAEYGYTANYGIGLLCLVGFLVIFWTTRKRYVNVPPSSRSIGEVLRILVHQAKSNWRARFIVAGGVLFLAALVMNIVAAFLADHGSTGKNISKASGAFIVAACVLWVAFGRDSSFMDAAKQRLGGHFDEEIVDGVKQVIRILPFNAFNVVWWVCQNQRANNQTIVQQTDMRLGSGPFARQIPGPTMQMFNPVSVLFLVPLFDRVVYPLYERVAGKPASRYGKILTGYWLAVLAMVWTGCFEILRKSRPVLTYVDAQGVTKNILNNDGHQVMNAIAWYAAIPQYFLVALASILIVIPSYDIGYSEVPQSMRSTTVALGFFVNSMGSTLQSVVVLLLGKFIPANLNKGHMEYLHFTLAGIMLVNIFFFWIVMRQMQLGMVPKLAKAARTKHIEIAV